MSSKHYPSSSRPRSILRRRGANAPPRPRRRVRWSENEVSYISDLSFYTQQPLFHFGERPPGMQRHRAAGRELSLRGPRLRSRARSAPFAHSDTRPTQHQAVAIPDSFLQILAPHSFAFVMGLPPQSPYREREWQYTNHARRLGYTDFPVQLLDEPETRALIERLYKRHRNMLRVSSHEQARYWRGLFRYSGRPVEHGSGRQQSRMRRAAEVLQQVRGVIAERIADLVLEAKFEIGWYGPEYTAI